MSDHILRPGSVALVTGAGRGIGLATARALAAEGIGVICAGRDLDRLARAARDLGGRGLPLALDVTDADRCREFLNDLPADFRGINILVNNAGHDVGGRRLFHLGRSDDWDDIIETNVKGLMRVTRAVLPGMLAGGEGHIINVGSVAGIYSDRGMTAYNASKFAVHGFTEALRKDLDDTDVRVTEILPGLVKTDFARNRNRGDERAAEEFYGSFPAHLVPDDIARAIVYALKQPPHVAVSQLVIEPVRKGT